MTTKKPAAAKKKASAKKRASIRPPPAEAVVLDNRAPDSVAPASTRKRPKRDAPDPAVVAQIR